MAQWIDACAANDIDEEDVIRFDHDSRTFIIARDHEDNYYCADGLCTHENIHLCDGLVVECTIECPKHSSIFVLSSGEVETPPACDDLRTYPTRLEDGRVFVQI
ncbi:MocE family 2Fe-2S type ferredoxin [Jannaschia helgolandensis]|uniref:MocE family 2Fe-2S type ferredoxin n=1 Tax=Jannaschia helgolandensis TaxID=188906 RepID=UPI0030D86AB5|tara:strand:+ start:7388 stop:7699 length:312 start_codon:yes stop_codon:yes gene_type:complete